MRKLQRWIETAFETFLFNARLIVILAVLGSLTASVLMFVKGAIAIFHTAAGFVKHPLAHAAHGEGGEDLSVALISSVDAFLFATVLLIFAMGIYELFISKIDPASRTAESRPNWLQIHSLDDLKGAVGKVILMILIVRLFEAAVKMKYDHPLHLLYLGLAVLFVAAALYLQHLGHRHEPKHASDGHEYPPADDDEDTDHGVDHVKAKNSKESHQKPLTLSPAAVQSAAPTTAPAYAQPMHTNAQQPHGYAQAQGQHPSMPPVSMNPNPAYPQGYPQQLDPRYAQQQQPQQAYGAPPQPQGQPTGQQPAYPGGPPQQRR